MKYLCYAVCFSAFLWGILELLWVTEILPNFEVSGEIVLGKYNWFRRLILPMGLVAASFGAAFYLEKSEEEKLSKDTKDKLDDTLDKF